jgi:phosphatidylinositol 3-kinase
MKKQQITSNIEMKTNPVTEKYYILTRTKDDAISKGLTPDRKTHDEILQIIEKPDFTVLSMNEKHLLWKYRYSLKNDESFKKGIVKFLQSVNWTRAKEECEAIEMLNDWNIDPEQALPMLSVIFSANQIYPATIITDRCQEIRKYAISCLEKEDINTITMILLQLVQAYRYENFEQCQLKEFFLSKVTLNETIAHTFFWIVFLEMNNKDNLSDIQDQFKLLYFEFIQKLEIDNEQVKASLMKQVSFRERLYELSSHIHKISGVANKKNELRRVVAKKGRFDMYEFDPVPMPLDPSVQV